MGAWRALERLLDRGDQDGLAALSAEDVRELSRLYRKASADLILLRSMRIGADVVLYLEAVVARAYAVIHAPERRSWRTLAVWFSRGFPEAVRVERRIVGLSAGLLLSSMLLAFAATLTDPQAFDSLIPAESAEPYATRQDDPLASRFAGLDEGVAARFSAELFERNTRVSLLAFSLGLTAGIGTCAILVMNGVILGAIAANFVRWGQGLDYWAMVLPHGITELFAVVLGGAGGFILARGMLKPGSSSRGQALRRAGQQALPLVGMAVPLLAVSAGIEAYVTPMAWLPPTPKIGFAALVAIGLAVWIRAPWLRPDGAAALPHRPPLA